MGHPAGRFTRCDHHYPSPLIASDPGLEGHIVGYKERPLLFRDKVRKKVALQDVAPLKRD